MRFGSFEFTPATGELLRRGHRIKLVGQPRELLSLLIERPGEVVKREEMRSRLWPEETFVDFEHSLNTAVKKLRQRLGDSAIRPRFIETIARQGYRFIAPVEALEPDVSRAAPDAPPLPLPAARAHISRATISLAILFVAAALAIATFALFRHRSNQGVPRHAKLKVLVSGEGDLSDPAISPDGKMLAYVKGNDGAGRIYVQRIAGGNPLRLTSEKAREAEPAFSPDGERIAFTRYPAGSNRPQICLTPVFGGDVVCILNGARDPAWAPDGARLAFIQTLPNGLEGLAIANRNGTEVREIMASDGIYPFLESPSWSADGRSIAIERSMGGISGTVWMVPVEGGAALRLESLRPGIFLHHPVFAPDGRSLIYSSNRDGATDLWRRDLAKSGSMTQLTSGPGREEWPSVSRSGRLIFLEVESRDAIYEARLDTGKASRILSHAPFLWAPSISPDGEEIAFGEAEYNGMWRIWTMPLLGGNPRPLTSGEAPQIYGRFSHDGNWVIYTAWVAGSSRIWRVPRNGGARQPLTPANEGAAYGDLSPDGKTLAFVRTENGVSRVYLKRVAGGPERPLTTMQSTVPRWSPDGNWIAFSPNRSFESGILIIHPDGSGKKRLAASGGWPVWLPDGKRIAFRTLGPDGAERISTVTLDTGKIAHLDQFRFAGHNDPFDFSPDGRLIIYTHGETFSSEIWLLDPRP
ncbi:MAG: winged helix-turn-helix domain-containing protein [Terriglobia bacterium]